MAHTCSSATEYHALRLPTWKNNRHASQWLSSLNHLGKRLALPLPEITSAGLPEILEPLKPTHHETGTRIRRRVEELFDRATIAGIVATNPATPLQRVLRAASCNRSKTRRGAPQTGQRRSSQRIVLHSVCESFVQNLAAHAWE